MASRLAEHSGRESVILARPESLGLAAWSHRVTAAGQASTHIKLPNGTVVSSENVSCVFNRLQYLPVPRFHRATAKDRDYAGAELQALVASWLFSFGPRVVNPSGPRGQCRGPLTERGWLSLTASVGLPVAHNARATAGRMLSLRERGERIDGFQWPGGVRGPAPAAPQVDESCRSAGSVLIAGDHAVGPLRPLRRPVPGASASGGLPPARNPIHRIQCGSRCACSGCDAATSGELAADAAVNLLAGWNGIGVHVPVKETPVPLPSSPRTAQMRTP